ncbi:hypothetical protein ACFL47_10720 [Candidatus Latescibacterota bacterium]
MLLKVSFIFMALVIGSAMSSSAQTYNGSPYTPGKDPNIDMYFGSWKESLPYSTHGSLIERDILVKGDPMNPPSKSAVLKYINRYTHATLDARSTTQPTTLDDSQEIIYIISGEGTVSWRKKTVDIYGGICMLVPAKCEFTLSCTGTEPMTMFLVNEPIPADFRPNTDILIQDETKLPVQSANGHWCHIVKNFFETDAGLGTLERVLTVAFDPMTIGHPHSHNEGCEEVWTALSGESVAFIGKEVRMQPEGTGYMIPPDGKTPHSNINTGNKQTKMFYFARYKDHEVRK